MALDQPIVCSCGNSDRWIPLYQIQSSGFRTTTEPDAVQCCECRRRLRWNHGWEPMDLIEEVESVLKS